MNLMRGENARPFDAVTVGVRPEHVQIDGDGPWRGKVRMIERLGNESIAYVSCDFGDIALRLAGSSTLSSGEEVRLSPTA